MRTAFLFTAACVAFLPPAMSADPPKAKVLLRSTLITGGLPLPESQHRVYSIALDADVNAKGEGKGTITFIVTPPNYDEYGDFVTGRETDNVDRKGPDPHPAVTLDCKIELLKKGWIGRVNEAPPNDPSIALKAPKFDRPCSLRRPAPGSHRDGCWFKGKTSVRSS